MWDKFGVALGEAATWRGLIMIAMAVGIHIEPDMQAAIIQIGLALAGALAVLFKRNPESIKPKA